jgi:hypothetical protein
MRRRLFSLAVTVALAALSSCVNTPRATYTHAGGTSFVSKGQRYVWSFDEPNTWKPGTGAPLADGGPHRTFHAALGRWQIERDESPPSAPNVYRQSKRYDGDAEPRVLVGDLVFGDLTLHVKCRPESGLRGESCGVIFRARDSDNYLLVRADAIAQSIEIVRITDGLRETIASAHASVERGQWHALALRTRGDKIVVSWDGAPGVIAEDDSFPGGKIGLWTGADSVTAFDDLDVRAD